MEPLSLQERVIKEDILPQSSLSKELHAVKLENERLLVEINTTYHSNQEMLAYLEKITGKKIDESTTISQPFYSDFGRHISFGKNIFINKNVLFVDLGGITIEDDVLIGPDTRLITVNHLTDPDKRRGLNVKPIRIKQNAWIGANVTILPGVTVGENAIVAADSTVTKDVLANTIVVGSPAKIIKKIQK